MQTVGNDTVRAQTETLTSDQLGAGAGRAGQGVRRQPQRGEHAVHRAELGQGHLQQGALRALLFFLLVVVIFLSLYFEWKMAVAAMVALVHDLVITAGLYSLVGFEVTPATVIGFLTILGYSLYDTVVVFDKVRENTAGLAGGSRMTYSQAANLAVNQTLVRSINTSIIALLPVAAILFVGVVLLGAGPLKDLALALFVGVAVGAYSSIFIATPLLAELKEREPAMQALAKRVASRRGGRRADDAVARAGRRPSRRPPSRAADDAVPEAETVAGAAPRRRLRPPEPGHRRRRGGPAVAPSAASRRKKQEAVTDAGARPPGCWTGSATSPTSPTPGIVFKDITPLLADAAAFAEVVEALSEPYRGNAAATRWPASRPAGSSSARRWRGRSASASSRCARRASCRATSSRRRTTSSTARRRSR